MLSCLQLVLRCFSPILLRVVLAVRLWQCYFCRSAKRVFELKLLPAGRDDACTCCGSAFGCYLFCRGPMETGNS